MLYARAYFVRTAPLFYPLPWFTINLVIVLLYNGVGCCFGSYSFEQLVQCADGHLFCIDCLRRYFEESAFGAGKTVLCCMFSGGCQAIYPRSELLKADVDIDKLIVRQQEEVCVCNLFGLTNDSTFGSAFRPLPWPIYKGWSGVLPQIALV